MPQAELLQMQQILIAVQLMKKDTEKADDKVEDSQNDIQSLASETSAPKDGLSAEELEAMGQIIDPDRALAPDAYVDLVIRVQEIIKKGLPADEKKSLAKKILPSKNCSFLDSPKLNMEVRAALHKKRFTY